MTTDPNAKVCCGTDAACVFTKALLARQARCGLACRQAVGEADLVRCADRDAQHRCQQWLDALRERAGFALKLKRGAPLLHARALQLQCGGLQGLRAVLATEDGATTAAAEPPDVARMLDQLATGAPAAADLPWHDIVATVVGWQARRRAAPAPRR